MWSKVKGERVERDGKAYEERGKEKGITEGGGGGREREKKGKRKIKRKKKRGKTR